ncbi:hypothetical protein [Rhizobium leguminosarum]|uniref:hypothetical protein n=1 Tax=Rhizobium leguminosarum TaxID=384 RepID=UPI003F98272E
MRVLGPHAPDTVDRRIALLPCSTFRLGRSRLVGRRWALLVYGFARGRTFSV